MPDHKVVETDNFNGDYPNEKELCWVDANGKVHPFYMTGMQAHRLGALINEIKAASSTSPRYYTAYSAEYKLIGPFEP